MKIIQKSCENVHNDFQTKACVLFHLPTQNDYTNFNLHKTCGTIDFLKSILISNTQNKYDLFQGIYDAALSKKKISNLIYFFDPISLFNKNFLNIFWGKEKKY